MYAVRNVESFLDCIKRTKECFSAAGDAAEVNSPASEWRGYFMSDLSRFILEILPAKLSIASHEKLEVHPATRSAARMKGESEQEQDTELQKKSKELAGYIVWVGVYMVAAASELNCCHPHTF